MDFKNGGVKMKKIAIILGLCMFVFMNGNFEVMGFGDKKNQTEIFNSVGKYFSFLEKDKECKEATTLLQTLYHNIQELNINSIENTLLGIEKKYFHLSDLLPNDRSYFLKTYIRNRMNSIFVTLYMDAVFEKRTNTQKKLLGVTEYFFNRNCNKWFMDIAEILEKIGISSPAFIDSVKSDTFDAININLIKKYLSSNGEIITIERILNSPTSIDDTRFIKKVFAEIPTHRKLLKGIYGKYLYDTLSENRISTAEYESQIKELELTDLRNQNLQK
jgi:hypothetical protein